MSTLEHNISRCKCPNGPSRIPPTLSTPLQICSRYRHVAYHNLQHAVFVLQGVFLMLLQPEFDSFFCPEDKLSILVAALCHDVDHDGRTNSFHVNTQSQLALTHNDTSPLENHHCSVTFHILKQTTCNFMDTLPLHARRRMRSLIVQLVLATDMANHTALTR